MVNKAKQGKAVAAGKPAQRQAAQKTVCIVCRLEREGIPVADDVFISTVRKLKSRLGRLAGNRLVVCPDDIGKAQQKRGRFEKYLMWCSILAFAVLLVLTLSSRTMAFGLLAGVVAGLFVMLMAMVSYYPKMDDAALKGYLARTGKSVGAAGSKAAGARGKR